MCVGSRVEVKGVHSVECALKLSELGTVCNT